MGLPFPKPTGKIRRLLAVSSHLTAGLWLSLLVTPCFGTTIVAILHRDEAGVQTITFGADGRQVLMNNGRNRLGASQTCKIWQVGPYLFGIAGTVIGPGFDLFSQVKEILSRAGSLEQSVKQLEPAIIGRMTEVHPPNQPGTAVSGLLIIDTLHFPQYYFGSVLHNETGYAFDAQAGIRKGPLPLNTRIIVLGLTDHFPDVPGLTELLSDPVTAIRTLIQVETDAHPDSVGPPTAIVEVTESGIHWIERGACEAAANK